VYWDHASVSVEPVPPEWTRDWPDILNPVKIQLAREGLGTWRSLLASLVTILFWGNALLYIADRTEAFADEKVVGLGRYLIRGTCITLLLALPLAVGFGLLVIPGLLVAAILIAAATITAFREKGIFRSIGEGYRLVTQSLPGQSRILGFSRSFFHLTGAYALVIGSSFLLSFATIFLAAGLQALVPAAAFGVSYGQSVIADLGGSFLNLSFSIFVLRLYSEYRTLLRR
jgi:hypothetical protein